MAPREHAKALLVLSTLLLALLAGCSPKAGEAVVARVGDTPITLAEYENLYIKSSGSREVAAASTMDERTNFLGLMTNFRLKLADAYRSGLDKQPAILNEIQQYRGSLAASYLTDREVTSPGIRKLYERRTEEIRASHILLNLSPQASADDSASTYAKAYDLIKRLKGGADFTALAMEFSQDPSAKQNNGDLYYFTGGQMVPVFEDAAFALKVGEISSTPVRTPYGLHILKIVDRKPAPGEVQCSHIMIRFERQDPTPEDTTAALQKIRTIQDSLTAGQDFAGLAQRNSGDPGSAARGGDLGWFTRRRWIQSFDEVAVNMKPGEVSGIIRTAYGYHIIKCVDARPPKGFEESKKDLQQLYQQVRFQEDYDRYLGKLKKETGYMRNDSVMAVFFSSLDSTSSTRDSAWADSISTGVRALPLFRFGTRNVSVDSTIHLMKNRPDMAGAPLRPASLRPLIDKIGEQLIYEARSETIERDYPEFAGIMKEYSEGILLYQIEQDRVWNRVAVSDTSLKKYFEENRARFRFPDRVQITSMHVANDSMASLYSGKILGGSSLEQIAVADSARMKAPTSFPVFFKGATTALTPADRKSLNPIKDEMMRDASLRLTISAYRDTTVKKTQRQSQKLAEQRIEAMKTHLVKKLGLPSERVVTQIRITPAGIKGKEKTRMLGQATVDISGRRAGVVGGLDHALLPIDSDERSATADSLKPGQTSLPVTYEGGSFLVRLDSREPARDKTFEEAGTEVSSAFQEYESKRIEAEWLQQLRTANPVVEYPEVLQNAFAPVP
jgi:peptidyl-prolyl cis-trans isomerase SurA